MQQTTNDTTLWFESELTARYQADLSGAHARAYLRELREREEIPQSSLDHQIDSLLELWRYSLLDVALAKKSTIPPLDLLKALVVIEAYDQAIALVENGLETSFVSRANVFFDLGIFCLDLDACHPKAALFFQQAFQLYNWDKSGISAGIAQGALSYAKHLLERKRMTEAEQFFEIAFQQWELHRDHHFEIVEAPFIWMLTQLGYWEKAETIVAAHPNEPLLLAGFGVGLRDAGQIQRGDKFLAQAKKVLMPHIGGNASRFIYFYAENQAWQAAIDLLPFILEDNRFSVIQTILLDALKMQAWQIAEELCDLISIEYLKQDFLTVLVESLVEHDHYQEAQRVAKRITDPYYQDDAFAHIIKRYGSAQRWPEARAIFYSIPDLEEYPACLRSYLEMCIQEGALTEASEQLEQVSQVENRLIVETQLAVAYQKYDPSYEAGSVLAGIAQQALRIEDDNEQQHVLDALVMAYATLKLWHEAMGILAQTKRVTAYTYSFEREIYTSLLHGLIADDQKELAQECVALFSDQRMRHELFAYLVLALAKHGDRRLVEQLSEALLIEQRRQYTQDMQGLLAKTIKDALTRKQGLSHSAYRAYPSAQTNKTNRRALAITRGQTPQQSFDIAIAQQQWRKAERIIQQIQPEYRAEFYRRFAWHLLPSKRWNELIRITRFVKNEPSMQMWWRLEAFERLIRGLAKAHSWRQALRVISTLETADMQRYDEPRLQANLLVVLIEALVERSWFKQALSVYSEISDPFYKAQSCLHIANGLAKAHSWRQAELLLQDIDNEMGHCLNEDILNQLLLACHRSQRYATLDRLCQWMDRIDYVGCSRMEYFTTLCKIGRLDHAEALAKQKISHSERDYALNGVVEGLLKIKDFEQAERIALEIKLDRAIYQSCDAIADCYVERQAWDRQVCFAQRAIRQADSYETLRAYLPLLLGLLRWQPHRGQTMLDLLIQQIALEERLLELG